MAEATLTEIQARYAAVATSSLSGDHAGVRAIAQAFGYSPEELASAPAEAYMGLSCGNPIAVAGLRLGETVLDLGCGGGLDVLLAAAKVGPAGRAIGIDMTYEMVDRARRNATWRGLGNVEFYQATIDRLPLTDSSVDCVISNCVINLAADKGRVFREMFRVLKAGGRVAVSDIALKKPLPEELAHSVMAYVACIAGALPIEDYQRGLRNAGFVAVQVVDTGNDLNAYASVEGQGCCCSPAMTAAEGLPLAGARCNPRGEEAQPSAVHRGLADLLRLYDLNDFAASVQVYALKGA